MIYSAETDNAKISSWQNADKVAHDNVTVYNFSVNKC
jgi:hypothetical protein